jgi:hypothetical protein
VNHQDQTLSVQLELPIDHRDLSLAFDVPGDRQGSLFPTGILD